jgi:hypothetical protein
VHPADAADCVPALGGAGVDVRGRSQEGAGEDLVLYLLAREDGIPTVRQTPVLRAGLR